MFTFNCVIDKIDLLENILMLDILCKFKLLFFPIF